MWRAAEIQAACSPSLPDVDLTARESSGSWAPRVSGSQTRPLRLSLSLQIRRLRIEIEKLQWLHQQELSEMKHNLGEAWGGVCPEHGCGRGTSLNLWSQAPCELSQMCTRGCPAPGGPTGRTQA